MRCRGCSGGFHVDAIAAIDIALWDLYGKLRGVPIRDLLGPTVNATVPGYLSGLPAPTLDERISLATEKYAAGHRALKFAAVVSHEGILAEMCALRRELGSEAQIMVD